MWLDEPCYDPKNKRELLVAPREATFVFGPPIIKASVGFPLREGDKLRPLADTKKIKLPISDEIMLLEISR